MLRVIHFEIPVDDPERAVNFYKKVFEWKIDKWEGPEDYWLVNTSPHVSDDHLILDSRHSYESEPVPYEPRRYRNLKKLGGGARYVRSRERPDVGGHFFRVDVRDLTIVYRPQL